MNADAVLTRALGALLIIAFGLALYWLYNRSLQLRARREMTRQDEPAFPGARQGVPLILYFTTPECAPCKTVQRPALRRLQDQFGERLQVIEIDAAEQPEVASRWGVLSVPTTFILDPDGQLRHVNHGVARAEKLIGQLENMG